MPAQPEPAPQEDLYNLAPDPTAPVQPQNVRPVESAPIAAPAAVSNRPGPSIDPRLIGKKPLSNEPVVEAKPLPFWRGVLLPEVLIVVGFGLSILNVAYQGSGKVHSVGVSTAPAAFQMLAGVGLVFAAIYCASLMGGVSFSDPIWQVAIRLGAIALLPGAVGGLLQHWMGDLNGQIFGSLINLGLIFILFWIMFRMANQERVTCVMLIFIIRVAVDYFTFRIQGIINGESI